MNFPERDVFSLVSVIFLWLFFAFWAIMIASLLHQEVHAGFGSVQGLHPPGALDKLDVIECFESPGKELRVGEVLEKQKQIYAALGVLPPTSL